MSKCEKSMLDRDTHNIFKAKSVLWLRYMDACKKERIWLKNLIILIFLLFIISAIILLLSVLLTKIFGFEEISSAVYYAAFLGGMWSVTISKGWDMIHNLKDITSRTIICYIIIALIILAGTIGMVALINLISL